MCTRCFAIAIAIAHTQTDLKTLRCLPYAHSQTINFVLLMLSFITYFIRVCVGFPFAAVHILEN